MRSPLGRRRPRSVRVPTPGIRARVVAYSGDLLNVSATGALVRTARELPVGSEGPVLLDPEQRRIDLVGRVVRCDRVSIDLPGGAVLRQPVYTVGVMFTHTPARAIEGITQLCGGAISIEELPSRVVVVSEDAAVNASVSRALSGAGYHVRLVTNARETLAAAKESNADAVIVDVSSAKERSNWWVLDLLESDPATHSTPILALSESVIVPAERETVPSSRRLRVLQAPFRPAELLGVIAALLGS